ncbi:hypothetical protein NLI96_g7335 [Meripilus lineatus]|uniref:Transmembrane protein n=1 Tax=Meripilus lineatus TaxID=2056292 RepID=A0AAD5V150_9APHY|nr:hypothetical protein NLI96_g7335 [Physisporinus lineatus]
MEIPLLSRELRFRWVFIFYFFARYVWLGELITMVVITHASTVLNCPGKYYTSNAGQCGAPHGTEVTFRFLSRCIFYLLIALAIGQWITAIIVGARKSRSVWDDRAHTCVYVYNVRELVAFYLYNTLILLLTIAGLFRYGLLSSRSLWTRVCNQGVFYFFTTFVVNIPMLIFAWLNLNPIMSIMFSTPAATLSVIASSRVVTSLLAVRRSPSKITRNSLENVDAAGTRGRKHSPIQQFTSNINIPGTSIDSGEIEERAIRISNFAPLSSMETSFHTSEPHYGHIVV